MPSDYEQITQDNIKRREEKFNDIIEFLSEQLYSGKTQFILELLQNAEDALARRIAADPNSKVPRKIVFRLFSDRLEVSHFGMPFNSEDVSGICDILRGTKKIDETQIGTFGIGFKSVYIFTSSPKIHSGDEHFEICNYIHPRPIPPRNTQFDETLFILPFIHKKLPPEKAFELIKEGLLRDITPLSLIFLRYLEEIKWVIQNDEFESYVRSVKYVNAARQLTIVNSDSSSEINEWLLFEREVRLPGENNKIKVEAAFKLKEDEKTGKKQIVRIKNSFLRLFFPTEKETHLGFLIQGPYDPTPSRDNIKKSERNKKIIEETALLVVETLCELKKMGLLTVRLLEALPIRLDDFPADYMFQPIVDAVRTALREQPLLPANDGSFVAGKNAKFAYNVELRKLLSQAQLMDIFNSRTALKWISGDIAEKTSLGNYLEKELGVAKIEAKTFARRLSAGFLEKQTDDWMIQFYTFLSERKHLWQKAPSKWDSPGPLRKKEFIRLEDGRHVIPFREDGSPNAYLPADGITDFPIIKKEIIADEVVLDFMKKFGIPEIDSVAQVLEKVLPKYQRDGGPDLSEDEYSRDIEKIKAALEAVSGERKRTLVEALKLAPFLRAINATTSELVFKKPTEIYCRTPQLEIYFQNNPQAWFLCEHEEYEEWLQVGVQKKPRFHSFDPHISYERKRELRGSSGFTREISCIDIELDGLTRFLKNFDDLRISDYEKTQYSLCIWNFLLEHLEDIDDWKREKLFKGEYRWFYYSERSATFDARWIVQLRNASWLSTNEGRDFCKPSEIALSNLPTEFTRNEYLSKRLGMKSNELAEFAKKLDIEPDDIDFLKALKSDPSEYQRLKQIYVSQNHRPEFPSRISANPARRQERVTERLEDATEKSYEPRQRSVRTSGNDIDPATWLKNNYTNLDGQMVCQICKEEMPFKKRDGEYYFEAVEIFNDLPIEHAKLRLALCPVCAAKYKEFVKKDPNGEMQRVKTAIIDENDSEVLVQLAGREETIRFVETHFKDLKTILREQSSAASVCADHHGPQ